ncbi:MAG: hypothetical protein A07HR60_02291 [uncultured archaeon A07HR60]|nr:MAG: hypothetical protein A07HR60_02291 [uncultured archaeon A07HR60]
MTDPRLQYAFVGLMALMFLGAIIDGNTILALVVGVTPAYRSSYSDLYTTTRCTVSECFVTEQSARTRRLDTFGRGEH